MNVQIAKEAYSKVKKETSSDAKKNHANVGMALKKLKSSMTQMVQNETNREDDDDFKKSYKGALYAIYVLQKSLDFDKGGELAQNLFRLYEFCKLTVQDVVMTGDIEKSNLASCCTYIGDIVESWEKVYN